MHKEAIMEHGTRPAMIATNGHRTYKVECVEGTNVMLLCMDTGAHFEVSMEKLTKNGYQISETTSEGEEVGKHEPLEAEPIPTSDPEPNACESSPAPGIRIPSQPHEASKPASVRRLRRRAVSSSAEPPAAAPETAQGGAEPEVPNSEMQIAPTPETEPALGAEPATTAPVLASACRYGDGPSPDDAPITRNDLEVLEEMAKMAGAASAALQARGSGQNRDTGSTAAAPETAQDGAETDLPQPETPVASAPKAETVGRRTREQILEALRQEQARKMAEINRRYQEKIFKASQRVKTTVQKRKDALDVLTELREMVRASGDGNVFMTDNEVDAVIRRTVQRSTMPADGEETHDL